MDESDGKYYDWGQLDKELVGFTFLTLDWQGVWRLKFGRAGLRETWHVEIAAPWIVTLEDTVVLSHRDFPSVPDGFRLDLIAAHQEKINEFGTWTSSQFDGQHLLRINFSTGHSLIVFRDRATGDFLWYMRELFSNRQVFLCPF